MTTGAVLSELLTNRLGMKATNQRPVVGANGDGSIDDCEGGSEAPSGPPVQLRIWAARSSPCISQGARGRTLPVSSSDLRLAHTAGQPEETAS